MLYVQEENEPALISHTAIELKETTQLLQFLSLYIITFAIENKINKDWEINSGWIVSSGQS